MQLRSVLGWLYIAGIIGLYLFLMLSRTDGNRPAKAVTYTLSH